MEAAIILARLAQYLGAATLFGTPLFLAYAFPPGVTAQQASLAWGRPLAGAAALVVLVGSVAYLCAQTAMMAGDPAAAWDPATLASVLTDSAMGFAIIARAVAAGLALLSVMALKPGPTLWRLLAALGVVALMSFAWTGHGAAGQGPGGWVHLVADLLHLAAAGFWIGALIAFAALLARPGQIEEPAAKALQDALAGFAGTGSAVVAVLVATGVANSWFLVGPARLGGLFTTPYGLVLLAKLAVFAGMIGLAARNRFTHTPALEAALAGQPIVPALRALRASVFLEAALGLAVLALVAVLGMLEPIAAQ
ncbi:MAG TPA: copper homeostasis membrane protein CopD [Phenylobacterium sp.]|nr:copper homeostasis membrane protein CopD [Phenylobacterium sp.]